MGVGVDSECLKAGEEDEDGGPAMIEGEREVDEYYDRRVNMVPLDLTQQTHVRLPDSVPRDAS